MGEDQQAGLAGEFCQGIRQPGLKAFHECDERQVRPCFLRDGAGSITPSSSY
jgi:hypothetical protein